ncbi:MAG TPA: hypothetical protein VF211_12225 [Burkholderiales bacterium]
MSDPDVASALGALSVIAGRAEVDDKWRREPYRSMKLARMPQSRALGLTPQGRRSLLPLLPPWP